MQPTTAESVLSNMTRNFFSSVIFLLLPLCTLAQEVQWASEVITVSSQMGQKANSAQQMLGRPNVFPNHTFNGCSWTPEAGVGAATFHVGFAKAEPIRQLALFINHAPNTIQSVFLIEPNGTRHELDKKQIFPLTVEKKVVRFLMPVTPFQVKSVQCTFHIGGSKNSPHVDAIGISTSEEPIQANINVAKGHLQESARLEYLQINSRFDEVNPALTPDGKTMYFSRKSSVSNIEGPKSNSGDIYMGRKMDNKWQDAVALTPPINNAGNNAVAGVTSDGRKILLYGQYTGKGEFKNEGLSIAELQNGQPVNPVPVRIADFSTKHPESGYQLSTDGRKILMNLERDDTKGSADLYISLLQPDGSWSAPIHMGPEVNSAAFEFSPFLLPDDRTLYFASYGFSGYGNADIYMSKRQGNGWNQWSQPENLGPVINSKSFDAFYLRSVDDQHEYFVSARAQGEYGDIYYVAPPHPSYEHRILMLKGQVFDSLSNEPLAATITVRNKETREVISVTESDSLSGNYELEVRLTDVPMSITAKRDGYTAVEEPIINFGESLRYAESLRNLYIKPYQTDENITLQNIHFERNSATLLPESYAALGELVALMEVNPELRISLSGHTETQGKPRFNEELSKSRAEAVKTYLTTNGIQFSRIETEGYGATRPLYTGSDPEQQRKNRRVEFRILKPR